MRRTLAGLLALAAAATLIGGSAVAAASAGKRDGIEHLRVITTFPDSRRQSTLATGAFTAGGFEVPGREAGKDVFPRGTFRVLRDTTSYTVSFRLGSCLSRIVQKGTYTLADGTGRYAGIRGHGHFTLTALAVYIRGRTGRCGSKIGAFQQVLTEHGPVNR